MMSDDCILVIFWQQWGYFLEKFVVYSEEPGANLCGQN
jgi:hypothetical protein